MLRDWERIPAPELVLEALRRGVSGIRTKRLTKNINKENHMNNTNSFFHHPEAILMEIALDATMAGATSLEMNLRGNFLDIHDDRPLKTDDDAWFHSFLRLMVASETIGVHGPLRDRDRGLCEVLQR